MRICPFDNCGAAIPDDKFACGRHWHHLNPSQKQTIHAAYADYLANRLGVEQLRAVQQRILDAVQGRRVKT